MTRTTDDPVANWQQRVGTLPKRGRISATDLSVVPGGEVNIRVGRPPAPERLSEPEQDLWRQLLESRRPQWLSGSLEVLETDVVATTHLQRLQPALREAGPAMRLHRQTAMLAAFQAVKLRLGPSAKVDKKAPNDGDAPLIA